MSFASGVSCIYYADIPSQQQIRMCVKRMAITALISLLIITFIALLTFTPYQTHIKTTEKG
jgi:hypothetical protein